MRLFSRLCQPQEDYIKIKKLLREIISIDGPPFHGSAADLDFWTTILGNKDDLCSAKIWFNELNEVIGFAWPDDENIDVFIHPNYKPLITQVLTWTEKQNSSIEHSKGKYLSCKSFVSDTCLNNVLIERGYNRTESYIVHFEYKTKPLVQLSNLTDKYKFKTVHQLSDIDEKIKTYKICFPNHEANKDKYISMMKTDSYNENLDLVVIAPDNSVASFANIWVDNDNNIGIIEPVGTHPNYRNKGLCKAVIFEGIRLLEKLGIPKAFIKTSFKNIAAQSLYKSIGFLEIGKEYVWTKKL